MISIDWKKNKVEIQGDIAVVSAEVSFVLECIYIQAVESGASEEAAKEYLTDIAGRAIFNIEKREEEEEK